MIDVRAAREAHHRGEVSNVGWIHSADNIADCLTKVARCEALERFLDEGVLRHTVEQWVIRDHFDDSDQPTTTRYDTSPRLLREQGSGSVESQHEHG